MQKFKLIKEYEDYYLISDKEIESGDEYVKLDNRPRTVLLGITAPSTKVPKLSKQNCEELFGVKQWDRTCFDCNKGFNFEQMISDHKGCPYCEGINYAGVLYEQPSEIEVEIEMEVAFQLKKRVGGITNMGKPLLDADGCLILKRVV